MVTFWSNQNWDTHAGYGVIASWYNSNCGLDLTATVIACVYVVVASMLQVYVRDCV